VTLEGLPAGPDLIEHLERTLGMAILVETIEAVEPGDSVEIRARLMFGSHTTEVAVTGASETQAWEELGRAAIAWRNSDFQHVQMWPGAG